MNKRVKLFCAIQCITFTLVAGVCHALASPQDQGMNVENIRLRLNEKCLLSALEFIADEKSMFPTIHSDDYYQEVQKTDKWVAPLSLGREMLKQLPNLRDQLRKSDENQFPTSLRIVIKATRKILAGEGYRNLVIGSALTGTVGQILLERTILKDVKVQDMLKFNEEYSSLFVSPKQLHKILQVELGELYSLQLGKDENRRKAFFSIGQEFVGDTAKTEENVRGVLAFESNYNLFHNYDAVDVLPVIGVILRTDQESDILTGLLGMKNINEKLPDEKALFIELCENINSKMIKDKLHPISGNYIGADFWNIVDYIRRNREWRTSFKEY